jgi:ABC-type multidrug transport system permease subunit
MNTKLIATVINAVISFIIIVPISFLMNKFINDSEMTFMEFFNQKWYIFLIFVVIFAVYNTYFKNKKVN